MPGLSTTVDPRPLALSRIGVGLTAALNAVDAHHVMVATTQGRLALPISEHVPPLNPTTAAVHFLVALVAGVALCVGYRTRVAAAAVALATWSAFAWEQQTYSNHAMLTAWLALWLAFSRSGAAWSVDNRLRPESQDPEEVRFVDQVPLMTQLSVCYLFAALSKLNPHFLSGETLQTFSWVPVGDATYRLLAVATIATELFLVVGLWLPATRRLAVLAGVALHLTIVVAMPATAYQLASFSLLCLSQYWMFGAAPTRRRALVAEPATVVTA